MSGKFRWILLGVVVSAGCSAPRAPVLRVEEWNGAAGVGWAVQTQDDQLTVTKLSDHGHPPKEVYRARLSEAERRMLARRVAAIPLKQLEPRYYHPDISDGYFLRFRLPSGEGFREIEISNILQRDLALLTADLDQLLPWEYRFNYTESIRQMEDEMRMFEQMLSE